jgi:hypothetical protein
VCLPIPGKAAWTAGGMKKRENARSMSPAPNFFFATSFLFFIAKYFFAKTGALLGNGRAGYPVVALNLWNCHFICAKNHIATNGNHSRLAVPPVGVVAILPIRKKVLISCHCAIRARSDRLLCE